jgi:hypothetical protein
MNDRRDFTLTLTLSTFTPNYSIKYLRLRSSAVEGEGTNKQKEGASKSPLFCNLIQDKEIYKPFLAT